MSEKGEKNALNGESEKARKSNWSGDMLERTRFLPQNIALSDLIAQLPKTQREKLLSGYDIKNLARIFEDGDIMNSVDCFLKNGMNVSDTARILYMHRNTLIYRLNKIESLTGLDVRVFDMAVTFEILRAAYEMR